MCACAAHTRACVRDFRGHASDPSEMAVFRPCGPSANPSSTLPKWKDQLGLAHLMPCRAGVRGARSSKPQAPADAAACNRRYAINTEAPALHFTGKFSRRSRLNRVRVSVLPPAVIERARMLPQALAGDAAGREPWRNGAGCDRRPPIHEAASIDASKALNLVGVSRATL